MGTRLKTSDLVRTLLSFNGLSKDGREVRVRSSSDCERLTSSHRLTVQQNGNKLDITVPQLPPECSASDIERVRRSVYERVSTFLNSGDMASDLHERGLADPDNPSPLGSITEAFEGMRASRDFAEEWPGSRSALSGQQADRLDVLKNNASTSDQSTAGYIAAESLASRLLDRWNPEVVANQNAIEDEASPDLQAALDKLEDSGIIDELEKAQSYEDSRELARRAFELLYEKSAEQEEQECQQAQAEKGDGDEDGECGEGEGDGDGEGEGTPSMADLQEAMDQEGKGRATGKGYRDEVGEHSTELKDGESEQFAIGADGDGQYIPTPDDMVDWVDFTKPSERRGHKRASADLHSSSTGLANAVRRAIQVRSQAHYVGAQKSGKLQRKNLYRIACPTVGSGEWNSRFRRQRTQADTLDTAVMLLVDFSGSMFSARKIKTAMGAAVALADVLSTLNVPFAIHGFTCEGDVHRHLVFKHFGGAYNRTNVVESLERASGLLDENEDYKAIDLATRALMTQRQKRKLMITLSDGHPSCCRPGAQEPEIVRYIDEHKKYVDYVGIGIMDDAVEKLYPVSHVLRNVEELGDAVLNTVKSKLV